MARETVSGMHAAACVRGGLRRSRASYLVARGPPRFVCRVMWKAMRTLYTFRSRLDARFVLQRSLASQPFTRADFRTLGADVPQTAAATADDAVAVPVWLQDLCAASSRRVAPLALRLDALAEHACVREHIQALGGIPGVQPAPPLCNLPWPASPRALTTAPLQAMPSVEDLEEVVLEATKSGLLESVTGATVLAPQLTGASVWQSHLRALDAYSATCRLRC